MPSIKSVLPHIVPIIKSYTVKGKEHKVLGSIADLYGWYYSLVENVNKDEPDAELVALVESLIKDKQTDLEKVKAIYYWTQQNIKYIANEYALGGFVPREANDVFGKKYGDCKDNSSVLYKMLEIAGLKGHLTWIGTRKIPYTYKELPTPIVDNHMILSYVDNGKTYFLDATGRYLPLELPSSFIQGKEALISKGNNEFSVEEVPVVDASKNQFQEVSNIKINNNSIIGNSQLTLSGYNKVSFFSQLDYVRNAEKTKEYYNTELWKGNNKFLIQNFKETNKFSYDKDFIIDYEYEKIIV